MICVMCKGDLQKGTVNYPVDIDSQFLLIKNVPALICSQCGEFFLDDDIFVKIESTIASAKKSNVEIKILQFAV